MYSKRAFIVALLMFLLLSAFPLMAQDAPPQMNSALADLSAKLARNISLADLDGYNFEQLTFPDARLGCDLAPAPTNPATNIAGFRFRLTLAGVEYDYRVSADSRIVVACTNTLQAITPPPPTPTTATTICPPNFEGFLLPQVIVGEEARVTQGDEPNRIRNAPALAAQQIGMLNPGTTFLITAGPSCGDGFVWWQIQAGDQVGWMAEGSLPDNYFIEPTGIRGSGIDFHEIAAWQADALRFYQYDYSGALAEGFQIDAPPLGGSEGIASSAWSPDGSLFAFVLLQQDADTNALRRDLYVTSFVGEEPSLVAEDIYDGLPISFIDDDDGSNTLLYAVAVGDVFTSDDPATLLGAAQRVRIVSQSLTPPAEPVTLGTVDYGVGCGGGGGDSAADARYQSEAGYGAHGGILDSTPYGIVYTSNCTGSGTALLDPQSGEWVTLGFNLSRVRLSPDRARIVGIQDIQPGADPGTLALVDLATGDATLISTTVAPSQVAWGDDDRLYFSRSIGRDANNQGSVALLSINIDSSDERELYSGEGYAIGRILPASDGSVFFSVISTDAAWEAALADGTADMSIDYRARLAYAPVSLYVVNFEGEVMLLGDDLAQATLNRAAFLGEAVG